jgi:dihydrofolate synthase / folylpolyglutamate synthase
MRYKNLQHWLNWQQTLNPKEIDLGLERVELVLKKLKLSADFFCPVISVAGTNGKGSTVAFIESILHQANITVGSYTSPHLINYNERIKINQQPVSDEVLCDAFEVIDQARGDIALTYFEFGTLASLVIFKKFKVDIAVLEVGLGGRLDAVNVIDADVSVITSIDIDHIDWLGDDIEIIACEKAGIMRAHKPSVVSLFKPPKSLLEYASKNEVILTRLGQDYLFQGLSNNCWQLNGPSLHLANLPVPALKGGFQLQNASAAIMAINLLNLEQIISEKHIAKGLQMVKLAGRFEQIFHHPQVIVDVAHNEQSARMLRDVLSEAPVQGRTLAVVAMLSDKAINKVLGVLDTQIDHWISAGLGVSRGMASKNMAQAVRDVHTDVKLSVCENVSDACHKARALAGENDRIIVFGSFYTVCAAIDFFKHSNDN